MNTYKLLSGLLITCALTSTLSATAQTASGTLVTIAGTTEMKVNNDQAIVNFFIEEQDKDKAKAASRVNQKMKAGTDLIKQQDNKAELTTRAYYTNPVYAEEMQNNANQVRKPQLIAWRVGQYLEVKTRNLKDLPALVANVQKTLAMNGVSFGLSEEAIKNVETSKIEQAYQNLTERIALVVKTMGRKAADAQIETLDFEGNDAAPPMYADMRMKSAMGAGNVEEPSFEPGVTMVSQRIVAKVRINK